MKGRAIAAALGLAIPAAFANAKADTSAPVALQIGGVELKITLPPGYCVPVGQQAGVAQLLAATDTVNVTDLTLYRCGAPISTGVDDYTLIKTPVKALMATVSRQQVLDSVGAEFDSPEFKALLKSGALDGEVGDNFNKVMPVGAKFDGALKPLGRDDMCAYIGGTVAVEGKGMHYTQAVGGCVTSVGGRVILIFRYGIKTAPQDILQLLRESKALVARIEPVGK